MIGMAAASLAGSMMGASATKKAAQAQANTAAQQLRVQENQYDQSRRDTLAGQSQAQNYLTANQPVMNNLYRQGGQAVSDIYNQSAVNQQNILNNAQSMTSEAYRQGNQTAGRALQRGLTGANQQLNYAYGDVQQLANPYISTGNAAMNAYTQSAMNPYESLGFKNKIAAGQDIINEKMVAMGLSRSGAAAKATGNMYNELAGQEQALAEGRQLQLANMGLQQTGVLQNLKGQYGQQMAQNYGQYGTNAANLATAYGSQMGNMYTGYGQAGLGVESGRAANVGNATQNMYSGLTSSQMATNQALANTALGTSSQLSGLSQNYGNAASGIYGQMGQNQGANALLQGQNNQNLLSNGANLFAYGMSQYQNPAQNISQGYGAGYGTNTGVNAGINYDNAGTGAGAGAMYQPSFNLSH